MINMLDNRHVRSRSRIVNQHSVGEPCGKSSTLHCSNKNLRVIIFTVSTLIPERRHSATIRKAHTHAVDIVVGNPNALNTETF